MNLEKQQNVFTRGRKKIHILFDGNGIKRAIIRMIKKPETLFVVGCIAWLSNKDILKAMASKRGCCIVCTKRQINKCVKKSTGLCSYKTSIFWRRHTYCW